jgi:hypothetical protein
MSSRRVRSANVTSPTRLASKEPPERDVGSGDLKHIPPADQAGAGIHLPHRYSRGPSGTDERPDAGADNQIGNQAPLLEGPEHTDVGKPF